MCLRGPTFHVCGRIKTKEITCSIILPENTGLIDAKYIPRSLSSGPTKSKKYLRNISAFSKNFQSRRGSIFLFELALLKGQMQSCASQTLANQFSQLKHFNIPEKFTSDSKSVPHCQTIFDEHFRLLLSQLLLLLHSIQLNRISRRQRKITEKNTVTNKVKTYSNLNYKSRSSSPKKVKLGPSSYTSETLGRKKLNQRWMDAASSLILPNKECKSNSIFQLKNFFAIKF